MTKNYRRAEHSRKTDQFLESVELASAELELQEAVAEILNKAARHSSGRKYDKHYYETLSKKCGVSPRSLKRFLQNGWSIKKAAKILYPLGYRISKISVTQLPQ